MKKQWFLEVVGLSALLTMLAGIPPVLGESNKSFGAEDCVVPSLVTPSFGAEDFIVESLVTPSFGTEDWVLASESVSFGAEGWIEGMEYSDVVATGTLPAPAREELSLDGYYPD